MDASIPFRPGHLELANCKAVVDAHIVYGFFIVGAAARQITHAEPTRRNYHHVGTILAILECLARILALIDANRRLHGLRHRHLWRDNRRQLPGLQLLQLQVSKGGKTSLRILYQIGPEGSPVLALLDAVPPHYCLVSLRPRRQLRISSPRLRSRERLGSSLLEVLQQL